MAGWLSRLFFGTTGGALPLTVASGGEMLPVDIGSPWVDGALTKVLYSDIFASQVDIVDRGTAMQVPSVKRGRSIIVGALADLPLISLRDGARVDRQPAWLNKTNTPTTAWHRMAATIDDLIFYGWSMWVLNRSTETGQILDAAHVARSRWKFDPETPLGIRVDGQSVTDASAVCLFQGPDEGILATGANVIRGAMALENAWIGRAQNPSPLVVLHEVERNGVTQAEAEQYVQAWSKARTSPTGAVGFLPSTINLETPGQGGETDLFTEGRNNVRLDVANLLNLPASVLDGSTATASLTYQTAQGEFSQLNEWLSYWHAPIEARLSQNDISPNGQEIRFDTSTLSSQTPIVGPVPATPQEIAA